MASLIIFNLIFSMIAFSLANPLNNFSNDMNFVTGTKDAKKGQFPYQISIQMGSTRQHKCSGSIIDKKWVLTAAHCVTDPNVDSYTIVAGNLNYKKGVPYKVEQIIIHEKYMAFHYDVALIMIRGKGFNLRNKKKIAVIEFLKEEVPVLGDVTISGWGQNSRGEIPNQLQFTDDMWRGDTADCRNTLGNYYFDGILCLAHKKAICFGDGGGPATYGGKLAGVSSFLFGNCSYDGYAKLSYFENWIHNQIGKNKVISASIAEADVFF